MYRSIAASGLLLCAMAAPASTRPQYGGTLHVETLDTPDALVRMLVFDRLTRFDANGGVSPALAIRWSQDNNAQRWQFWLRPGVHFHDGTEMSTEDVVRSLNDACASHCPWKMVRAVGMSVVLTSDSPLPTLPEELARSIYIIAHKQAGGELDGTGPFKTTSSGGNNAMLTAVNDAWSGRPFVDGIEIDGRRDMRAQLLDLSVGRADIVDLPPELVRQAMQSHVVVTASSPVDMLALTLQGGRLRAPEQRRAIAEAVDRTALWSVIYQKQGEASGSLLPNWLTGYAFLFSPLRNPARATELAAAARMPLTLSADRNDPATQLAAERIALNLHEAGLTVQVRPPGTPDVDIRLRCIHLEANDARAGLHEMVRELGADMDDGGGDAASLYRVEKTFLDDGTVVPLLWLPRDYAVNPRVRGLALAPDGTPLLADVSLKADQP
ncbi:MAG TPA: ABC transporter substrate-binding protein [Acidobacteriaceae bacterium]|nr:ABC transporter substrate-binding protein [Acidobacteriaceae bacterium]